MTEAAAAGDAGGGEAAAEPVSDGGEELAALGDDAGETGEAEDLWDVDALPEDVASRRVKFKVNGTEETMSLADALKGGGRRTIAATRKEMAAAEMVRKANEDAAAMFEDPGAVLKKLGPVKFQSVLKNAINHADPEWQSALEQVFKEATEEAALDPKERAARERETALEKRERELAERDAKIEAERLEAQAAVHRDSYEKGFAKALSSAGLPVNAKTMAHMAEVTMMAMERGIHDLSPTEALDLVRGELSDATTTTLGALEGDGLLDFLGDELVRKVNLATVARRQKRMGQQAQRPRQAPTQKRSEPRKVLTTEELRERWKVGR